MPCGVEKAKLMCYNQKDPVTGKENEKMDKFAHNPLLDDNTFVPDVEAHVWEDGRIYLYGSFDIKGKKGFCSPVHHVYSSSDMINWTDHGVVFSISDSKWAKDCGVLYAPDCAYKNGVYYLYYCVPDGRCGVARSTSPTGPFEDVGIIEGVWGIDPAVFIDDDGQAYLYWGQLTWCKAAKLKDNMVQIQEDTVTTPLTVKEHEFHEGSSVKKINGRYYYLFADTHRHGNRPSCLGYAVSDHPLKGFRYGGVIIDNFGCDPAVWNNHGSMEYFNGQWYIFYHRSTHGTDSSRRVCAEVIKFNSDGSIPEIVQTTSGVGGKIPADAKLPASYACCMTGNVRIESDTEKGGLVLGGIKPLDTATFRYLDFNGENTAAVKMKANGKCRAEIYIDGKYTAEIDVPPSDEYKTCFAEFDGIYGAKVLTLSFYGEFDRASVEYLTFTKQKN